MRVDLHMVAEALKGGSEGFEAIVRAYEGSLYALCLASTRSPEEAEDAVQEVFLKLLVRLRDLRDPRRFEPWLFAIARNELASRGRSRSRASSRAAPNIDPDALPAKDHGTGGGAAAALGPLIAALSAEQAQVVALRFGAGLSVADTALACGLARPVAKSRLHEAMDRMRRTASRGETLQQLSRFRIPLGMEEKIMESVETLRLGAGVIERMAIYDQKRLAVLACKGEKMDSMVLEAMGKIDGGTELVRRTGARMDLHELGMFLNYGDRFTEQRIMEELERTEPETAEALKQRMFVFEDFCLYESAALTLVIQEMSPELFAHGLAGIAARERNLIISLLEDPVRKAVTAALTRLPETPQVTRAAQQEAISIAYRMSEDGTVEIVRGEAAGSNGCIIRLAGAKRR